MRQGEELERGGIRMRGVRVGRMKRTEMDGKKNGISKEERN